MGCPQCPGPTTQWVVGVFHLLSILTVYGIQASFRLPAPHYPRDNKKCLTLWGLAPVQSLSSETKRPPSLINYVDSLTPTPICLCMWCVLSHMQGKGRRLMALKAGGSWEIAVARELERRFLSNNILRQVCVLQCDPLPYINNIIGAVWNGRSVRPWRWHFWPFLWHYWKMQGLHRPGIA